MSEDVTELPHLENQLLSFSVLFYHKTCAVKLVAQIAKDFLDCKKEDPAVAVGIPKKKSRVEIMTSIFSLYMRYVAISPIA